MQDTTSEQAEPLRLDGKITVGPIRLPRGWNGMQLMRRMEEFGLVIARESQASFSMKPSLGSFAMAAEGPGVLGYLVDDLLLEAEETELERFAKPLLKGLPFEISGEHELGDGKRLRCRTRVEACPEAFHGIRVRKTRELLIS
ncbi:hypothetical protein [Paracoccus sp. ME4]|uniref:hypothetical protein n=1 Tax=Paracoccus sp. ME4 TaxID=3138066 RepID=UPI00398B80A2